MELPDLEALKAYQPPDDLLAGRVVLVTGASAGIGRTAAKRYAALGATVVLLSEAVSDLEAVYDEIETAGHPKPAILPLNLERATAKDYDDLAENIRDELGHLDGLLNNAGWVGGLTPLRHYDAERWVRAMTVNLHAPFMIARACVPLLEAAADPTIVFSTDACTRAYWGAYGVAKHATAGLLRILADEHDGERPIRVNGIDTGPVRTDQRIANYPGVDPESWPTPEAVIAPYVYFIGPHSRGLTGHNIELQPGAG